MKNQYQIKAIGFVQIEKGQFLLKIKKEYVEALKGLDGFLYIHVFWWAHLTDNTAQRKVMLCEKPYKNAPDTLGVFATRSPIRPNPIAITPVMVLNIDYKNGIISIPYFDAESGSPIIDIKPYHPAIDRIKDVSVPNWCEHWPKWYEDSATFNWDAEFINANKLKEDQIPGIEVFPVTIFRKRISKEVLNPG